MINVHGSSKDVARLLGISQRRVQQLENDDIIQKNSEQKYDLPKTIEQYYQWKLKPNDTIQYEQEKALHEKAKREKAELLLAKMKNELHEASDVELVLTGMIITFKNKLLALPSHMASKLVGQVSIPKITEIITEELSRILIELSEYDPAMFAGGDGENADEDTEAIQENP